MAKNDTVADATEVNKTGGNIPKVTAPVEPTTAASSDPLSLNEFCIRLSTEDKRVELIGGFEHAERVAGRVQDTAENFAARYRKFINQPA